MPAISSEIVTLKGGLAVSIDALRVAWDLEDRQFRLEPVGEKLRVTPHTRLTAEDVAAIKAHRDELLAIAKYVAPAVQ